MCEFDPPIPEEETEAIHFPSAAACSGLSCSNCVLCSGRNQGNKVSAHLCLNFHQPLVEVDLRVGVIEADVRDYLFVLQHERNLDQARQKTTPFSMANV